jgi:ribosome-binding factor A
VAEEVRRTLARLVHRYRLTDSAREVSVTISEVQMSKDLRQARVYVFPLKTDRAEEPAALVEALNREAFELQKLLGAEVALKFCPRLRFYVDTSFDTADALSRAMDRAFE